jgi:hypothetical protein
VKTGAARASARKMDKYLFVFFISVLF